jgi:signal transduction histidine kinase
LRRIAEASTLTSDLGALGRSVAELIASAVGADACFVHRLDRERRHVVLVGATGEFRASVGKVTLSLGEGVAGWVAANAEPAVIMNKFDDPRYVYLPELRGEDFVTLISVPLLRPGNVVVGAVNVHWAHAVHDPDEVLATLIDVANLFAGALEAAVLHAELAAHEEELSNFTSMVLDAAERERTRIASDIHDGIGSLLVSLRFHLDAAQAEIGDGPGSVAVARATKLVKESLIEVRSTLQALRPVVIDDFGLPGALQHLGTVFPGLEVVVAVEGTFPLELSRATALYRICQEALNNVVKHAGATGVGVRMRWVGDDLVLSISDTGNGFVAEAHGDGHGGFGLHSMRERAELLGGKLQIFTKRDEGTTVVVTLPKERTRQLDAAPAE